MYEGRIALNLNWRFHSDMEKFLKAGAITVLSAHMTSIYRAGVALLDSHAVPTGDTRSTHIRGRWEVECGKRGPPTVLRPQEPAV